MSQKRLLDDPKEDCTHHPLDDDSDAAVTVAIAPPSVDAGVFERPTRREHPRTIEETEPTAATLVAARTNGTHDWSDDNCETLVLNEAALDDTTGSDETMTELVRVQPASSGPRSAWAASNSPTPLAMTTDAGDVETRVSPLETPIPQWAPPNPIPFPFLQRPPAWKPPYHAMAAFGVLLIVTLGCLVARCKSDGDPATVSVDATSDAPPAPVAL
ncbi:MAG TPA: hypothetical protein VM580_17025, partial [Labilithrix sp.]|nr:hypothetical protein [Labilithrix sp.]